MSATTQPPIASSQPERKFQRARVLAGQVGVCAKTLHRWANDGLIHRHKVNARVVLYDEAEVLRFIEKARVEKPAAA